MPSHAFTLLTWQTCNVIASRVGCHGPPVNKRRSATSKHASANFHKPSLEMLAQGVLAGSALCREVGDFVLVHDDDSPPLLWKLARVTEQLPGRDGVARACCL
ncbi:hypothetical protein HPB49_003085 [Dermacentor silvarum]|uniref:Uncharacterized protein n=1 Tax=Dermacentor silvarum TaxID=543639 RepID=A0ACB8DN30_DERSI|nr:hypothetical protein HPB49_003085 [Dermacentor silvarum]